MKKFVFIFFLVAVFLCIPVCLAPAGELPIKRPFTHPTHFPSVVRINNIDGRGCSGWVAMQNVIITAGHCTTSEGERLFVMFEGGAHGVFVVKKRVFEDPAHSYKDMAILVGPTGKAPFIPMATAPITQRIFCMAIGYGGPKPIQQSTICRTYAEEEKEGLLPNSGRIDYGDSGGPVVTGDGVIGMNESLSSDRQPIFWIVPSHYIKDFMDEALSQ